MSTTPTQRTPRALRHKYHAKPASRQWPDGTEIKFQSTKEAKYYDKLCLAVLSGELIFFLRQTPFHLPGGVKYICDFLEFWADGMVRVVDVKGRRTKEYIRAKKQVEALYPVEIIEA